MSTDTKPGDLQDTTDQPRLTTPGSRDRYLSSLIETNAAKQGKSANDYVFSIYGITYLEGLGPVPCFISEERYLQEDAIKSYHGCVEDFVRHLRSYIDLIDGQKERKLIGVFYREKLIESEEDKLFTKWDLRTVGPRLVSGFI